MGLLSWDLTGGFSFVEPVRTPRLTIRCEYPGSASPPDEVSFRLSPSYGLLTARDVHDWFLAMLRNCEEFEVETDRAGELPIPFWSETIRRVVAGSGSACGEPFRSIASDCQHPSRSSPQRPEQGETHDDPQNLFGVPGFRFSGVR